jgi:hypothetical protein
MFFARRSLMLGFVAVALVGGLYAHSLDGNWTLKMPGPSGEDIFIPFTLKVEGETVTGEFQLEGGRVLKIENGKLEGDKLSWTLKRPRGDGSSMTYQMTGKVENNDSLSGSTSADMGGQMVDAPWSAQRKK